MAIANQIPGVQTPTDMDKLLKKTRELGAIEGAKRLELVRSQSKQLTPHAAYLLLDPTAVQEEIEEAQVHRRGIQFVHVLRNILSLAPLIATWAALFVAVTSYQQDLIDHPNDNLIPFLQLWQDGFNGITGFTFAWAAGLDVALLVLYLGSILALHEMERRAHACAVEFIENKTWLEPVNHLMADIDKASKPFVADKSDIDNVITAVDKIVEAATEALKQTVTTTMSAIKLTVDSATDNVKQTIGEMTEANKQVMQSTQQSIKSFIDDTRQAVGLMMTASEQAVNQVVTSSQAAVTQTLTLSQQSIAESNKRVETLFETQAKPLIAAFQRDLAALQGELKNYQGRLDDLTKASQTLADSGLELAKASKVLEDNAERYINISQGIDAQIASLSNIQQDVLLQIGSVAGNISTATGNITDAGTNMVAATHEVKVLAWQLDRGMQTTMHTISANIEKASLSLQQLTPPLEAASERLYRASNLLASIRLFPFFGRRSHQP